MADQDTVEYTPSEQLPTAIRVSEALRKFVDLVGRGASWLFVPLILITVFDVVARKLIWIQIWLVDTFGRIFESTLLQELEWHFHTGLFALVLGYGYIWNSHVRVDLVRESLSFRKKAWLEFFGLTFFLLPYCCIVIWFALGYAYSSYEIGEISASQVGLSHRWAIKSVLVIGLIFAALAGIAVWLQVVILLWGPQDVRFKLMTLDWPEEEGTYIEGKKRIELEETDDVPTLKGRAAQPQPLRDSAD